MFIKELRHLTNTISKKIIKASFNSNRLYFCYTLVFLYLTMCEFEQKKNIPGDHEFNLKLCCLKGLCPIRVIYVENDALFIFTKIGQGASKKSFPPCYYHFRLMQIYLNASALHILNITSRIWVSSFIQPTALKDKNNKVSNAKFFVN